MLFQNDISNFEEKKNYPLKDWQQWQMHVQDMCILEVLLNIPNIAFLSRVTIFSDTYSTFFPKLTLTNTDVN